MKLGDLQQAIELERMLRTLPGPAEIAQGGKLTIGELELQFAPDELARLIEWRRGELNHRLAELGIETEFSAGPADAVRMVPAASRPAAGAAADDRPAHQHGAGAVLDHQLARPLLTPVMALTQAEDELLGEHKDLLARGLIDQPHFNTVAMQREGRIKERAELLLAQSTGGDRGQGFCHCGEPATTTIDGSPYCDSHAAAAPRRERPSFLRRLVAA